MNLSFSVDVSALEKKLASVNSGPILETAIVAGMEVIRDEWKGLFRESSAPSIPGAPPRVQTGAYRDSIEVIPGESGSGFAEAAVGTVGLEPRYDIYLEYGTSRMPPHPIMRPAFDISEKAAKKAAVASIKSALARLLA